MGREAATYVLALAPGSEEAVVVALLEGGAERVAAGAGRTELCVRDPHRYWVDLHVYRDASAPRLEIRIALTNDEWSIRAPLERALAPLPAGAVCGDVHDGDGVPLGAFGAGGWSRALEEDFGRRRAQFVARVGDFTAPISADHVYLYVHQTRWHRDTEWAERSKRDAEINRLEQLWDPPERERGTDPGGRDA